MARAILVVDDERDMLATYERLLRRQGFRVLSAVSRFDGLRALEVERLALVVTDLRLPDGSGLDVVTAAQATTPSTPVIVVTGFPSAESRREVLAAGAAAYLGKPFGVSTFSQLVGELALAFTPEEGST